MLSQFEVFGLTDAYYDYHQTPFGLIPGALALSHAMHSLLQYENIQPVPKWLKWLIHSFRNQVSSRNLGLFSSPKKFGFATPLILVPVYQIPVPPYNTIANWIFVSGMERSGFPETLTLVSGNRTSFPKQ